MSKLLRSIEDRLAVEGNEYVRGELTAKRAAYFARTGCFEDAKSDIAEVRSHFGDGRSGRVTVLIMIAEGLLLHFESLGTGAFDRILRAQVLAQVGRDQELIALASAWKAYFEFEKSEFEAASRSIGLASTTAADDDSASRSRIAAVLFTAFALCGDLSVAQRYFLLGREHALKDGDQAGVDALLHNKAVFTAAYLRAANCIQALDPDLVVLTRTEINSAKNLQQLARIRSLTAYIDLADARLSIIEGRFDYALHKLEQLHESGPFPKGHFRSDLGLIEQAYCLAKLGRIDEALRRADVSQNSDLAGVDVDDRLVTRWQLLGLARMDERFGALATREADFAAAKEGYAAMTSRVRKSFAAFTEA